ncbi:MAG: class I SAM-dependent RNA methyltransferase [Hyphomonadaceae bacterium]|nr:class I SAM-dependent RNA methyltransferase [Clostridia bacterium]
MQNFEIIIPTLFGLEAITAREVRDLGYETKTVADGKVTFMGDFKAVCLANLWLRTGERVLIKIGEFEAKTFDTLFEKTKALNWADWIPKNALFPVKGYSLKSGLFSVPDCQAIVKKAVVESLKQTYQLSWFEEDGPLYQIQFSIFKDVVTIMLDSTGAGLHKRGYRESSNAAPLRETLAAAMVSLSFWRPERPFIDPFCGSGTLAIEAAMIGKNIAPGLMREFAGEKFLQIPKKLWADTRKQAYAAIKESELNIFASDIDKNAIRLTRGNAKIARVNDCIITREMPFTELTCEQPYGTIICNPPYGERMGDRRETEDLYREMGHIFRKFNTWSYYIITSHENFESLFSKRADKKRKMYNGMIKCDYFQYYGPKPPYVAKVVE